MAVLFGGSHKSSSLPASLLQLEKVHDLELVKVRVLVQFITHQGQCSLPPACGGGMPVSSFEDCKLWLM